MVHSEEIENRAQVYFENNDLPFGEPNYAIKPAFEAGAHWMLSQYEGLTPETVKEMLAALTKIRKEYPYVKGIAEIGEIVNKAEKETNP